MIETPIVSVCTATYNHARFIATALDSILAQRVDFPYEIVVADDASTDGAQAIIRNYAARRPDVFRPILGTVNTGSLFPDAIRRARGKYIALLDGDDYWTDPDKLSKQVRFLESHSDYVHCFHNVSKLYPDGHSHLYNSPDTKADWTLTDVLAHRGSIVAPASYVFRRGLFGDGLPDWHTRITRASNNGDWALVAANAEHGRGRYFPDVMSVYRFHGGGVWSSLDSVKRLETQLLVVHGLLERFGNRQGGALRPHLRALRTEILADHALKGRLAAAVRVMADGYGETLDWGERIALTKLGARALAFPIRARASASLPMPVRAALRRMAGRS